MSTATLRVIMTCWQTWEGGRRDCAGYRRQYPTHVSREDGNIMHD